MGLNSLPEFVRGGKLGRALAASAERSLVRVLAQNFSITWRLTTDINYVYLKLLTFVLLVTF